MKKIFLLMGIVAGILLQFCSGCTSIEASKVGNQVTVHMPVYVKPIIETKNFVINGTATSHSILGIFTIAPDAQAVGIDYGVSASSFSLQDLKNKKDDKE
jgi:hypothetical protein